jgi:SOS-response transcriptional repressor LexA
MSTHPADKESLHRLGAELLSSGMTVRIKVSGHSMYPALRPGDTVEIMPVEPGAEPEPGELVAIKRETDFIVHRFLGYFEREDKRWLFTRGDSVLHPDNPFPDDALAGRVVTVIRGRRTWRNPLPRRNIHYRWNRFLVFIVQFFDL